MSVPVHPTTASSARGRASARDVASPAWPGALLASPVLASVAPWAARLADMPAFPSVAELDAALRDRLAFEPSVSLEPQRKTRKRGARLDRDALYEVRIHVHRRVPTRERSWHDLTNALVWAAFPRSKRALAARQHAILDARVPPDATRLPGARTREQDALALLDEGGIVLMVRPRDEAAARRAHHDGDEVALCRMRDEGRVVPLVFGHALMEHVLEGGPPGDRRSIGSPVESPSVRARSARSRAGRPLASTPAERSARGCGVVLAIDAIPAAPEPRVEVCDLALGAWIARTDALHEPSPWRGVPLAIV